MGLAHASLRTMGAQGCAVVLDSRSTVGAGVGLVGRCAGLCGLVPAGVQQSTRVRHVDLGGQRVERMGRDAARAIRRARRVRAPRGRAPPLPRRHPVHHTGSRAGRRAARRAQRPSAVAETRQPTALARPPRTNRAAATCGSSHRAARRTLDARDTLCRAGRRQAGGSVPQSATGSPWSDSLTRARDGDIPGRSARPAAVGRFLPTRVGPAKGPCHGWLRQCVWRAPGALSLAARSPRRDQRAQTRRGRPHAISGRARADDEPVRFRSRRDSHQPHSHPVHPPAYRPAQAEQLSDTVRRLDDLETSGAVRQPVRPASPPALLPREAPPRQPGAAALSREAPPRQQPAAAPSREASAPASSAGAAAASPRRGSGAGDSGRARRR